MVTDVKFNAVQRAANLGGYEAPEVKVLNLQPEGVLCSSVFNGHDGFIFDESEDL